MSGWRRRYYALLEFYLKVLVKSKVIPTDPQVEVGLNFHQPIVYVLLHYSKIDLFTLRIQCLKHGLPDPLSPLDINGKTLPRYVFIHYKPHILKWNKQNLNSVVLFHKYIDLYISHSELDIQMVPVSIIFGRAPGKKLKKNKLISPLYTLNKIKKLFLVFWFGRDSFIFFSRPLSVRYVVTKHNIDHTIDQKLVRVFLMHFSRQKLVVMGPHLPIRQDLFKKLLVSKAIEKSIEDEARNKKISVDQAKKNAIGIMEEIAANFSYEAIRLSDRVLGWTWHWLYKGLSVCNADRVRKLAEKGHEIVYLPCHRSHMDYLILSYVLYHQGLIPPHIAAGINLNFWPAGPIFRRLGAFFIRRTFKSNKLYSTIFREYLSELFTQGASVEYFIEGGRSRTGRLLEPKTGTLTMTIQAMLRGGNRLITLVPIYVGYEHVMEIATYTKELHGAEKEQDSFFKILCALCKLRNFGQGYINFGEPLSLAPWLSKQVPQWRECIDPIEIQRPSWLAPVVDKIAMVIMVRINNATAVNAINLCANILLSSHSYSLTRLELLSQLACYLELLRNVPYSPDVTVPDLTPDTLLEHALSMKKFTIKSHALGEIICLSHDQAVLMTYYRNNIHHLLILPALIACIIFNHSGIQREQLHKKVKLLYPFLKSEFFMRFSQEELQSVIDNLIKELERQGFLKSKNTRLYSVQIFLHRLILLGDNIREILQRYAIMFCLLLSNPLLNREQLEKESRIIAQQLSILHGNAPEFFDKTIFTTLVVTLRTEEYINSTGKISNEIKVREVCNILSILIPFYIFNTIERASLLVRRLLNTSSLKLSYKDKNILTK